MSGKHLAEKPDTSVTTALNATAGVCMLLVAVVVVSLLM